MLHSKTKTSFISGLRIGFQYDRAMADCTGAEARRLAQSVERRRCT